jgi:hypothetical protein
MLPSWIEYHRIFIGVQHFIIYVNEPWATFTKDPEYFYHPPYVTYVLFQENLDHVEINFQQAAQIDVIQRLKGSSIEWVAMMDVDEYYQFLPDQDENSSPLNYNNLLEFLRLQFIQANDPQLASFTLSSHGFGYHPQNNSSSLTDLPICAQVGRHPDLDGLKLFARPNNTNYVSVHMVSGGEKQIHLDYGTTGLRYGHFHAERERFEGVTEIVLDDSFQKQACEVVRKELQQYFPRLRYNNITNVTELYAYDTEQDVGSRIILPK